MPEQQFEVEFDTSEIAQFARIARKYAPDIRRQLDKTARDAAEILVREVRREAPVGPDRVVRNPSGRRFTRAGGAMRNSVKVRGGALGTVIVVGNKLKTVGKKVDYVWYVHAGTDRGIKPNPFVRRGISEGFGRFYTALKQGLSRSIRELENEVRRRVVQSIDRG